MTTELADLNRMDLARFTAALGGTFDRAPWVAEAVYGQRPFATVAALHEAMFQLVREAPHDRQMAFFGKNVDVLATGHAAMAASITEDSRREHALIGLDDWEDELSARFHRLGKEYEAKFGYPFVIAVLRYTRETMVSELERRLERTADEEFATTLDELLHISRLRVVAKVTGDGVPAVNGRLSTHVLDTHAGRPAAGMAIELLELSGKGFRRIASAITNADGRTDRPLIGGRPLPIGRYELRFAVGDHYIRRDITTADPPFLDIVPLRFSIAEPEGHYHVPLQCTPWSYSTYRGS